MPDTLSLKISQGKAVGLSINDRVKAVVKGEVVGIDGILPIGDEEGTEMPVEVLDARVTLKVTSTKITRRASDDNAVAVGAMSMDEDEEEEV